jgi:hypothetical protein
MTWINTDGSFVSFLAAGSAFQHIDKMRLQIMFIIHSITSYVNKNDSMLPFFSICQDHYALHHASFLAFHT